MKTCGEPIMIKCGEFITIGTKGRYCERKFGHKGRHMTYYGGRRKYWTAKPKNNLQIVQDFSG